MTIRWCSSYRLRSPFRISIVSSTVGGSTITVWKRRSSAPSFSMYFRYSFRVDAPTHWSSPRASAGFSMLDASTAPSAAPAPTSVCSSSMKRMMLRFCAISLMTALSRSSNWPRYLVPAITAHVERQHAVVLERIRALAGRDQLREPLDDGGLPHARLADQHRIVLLAAREDLHHPLDFLLA